MNHNFIRMGIDIWDSTRIKEPQFVETFGFFIVKPKSKVRKSKS